MDESAPIGEEAEWCSVKRAAATLGIAERTAYAKASGLPRRKGPNGAKLIRLSDLKAAISDRHAPAAIVPQRGAVAAASSSNGGSSGSLSLDGEIGAAILQRFEEGATPIDVSIQFQTSLPRVRALHGEWRRAKEESASGSSVTNRLAEVEAAIKGPIREQLDGIALFLSEVEHRLLSQEERTARLAAIPGPATRSASVCSNCGARGCYSLTYCCTNCNGPLTYGFKPEK